MNAHGQLVPDFADHVWDLVNAACDGTLADDQVDALGDALLDEDVARVVLQHMQLRAAVRLQTRASAALESFRDEIAMAQPALIESAESTDLPTSVSGNRPLGRRAEAISTGWLRTFWQKTQRYPVRASFSVAGLVVVAGLLVLSVITVPLLINHSATPQPALAEQRPVAAVSQVVHATWRPDVLFLFEGAELLPGDVVALESGLVELTFHNGAAMTLQGPARLQIEDVDRAKLLAGHAVARAETSASRGFTVETEFATIVDLGTEFGIAVLEDKIVEISVFDGQVRATSVDQQGNPLSTWNLAADQHLTLDGQTQLGKLQATPAVEFVRSAPKRDWKLFDLLDVVAGGDGLGSARQSGLDPATGKRRVTYHEAQGMQDTSGKYHLAVNEPFIDGVFVPNGGAGDVQLDSAGNRFSEFADTDAHFYGTIWARGLYEPVKLDPASYPEPWLYRVSNPRRYSPSGRGLLGLHSNAGITFDLQALRQAHPEWDFQTFIATVANGENLDGKLDGKAMESDVWVFVDGGLRFQWLDKNSRHGVAGIRVELAAEDRFLTLVATDSGDSMRHDWIVLGDAALVAAPHKE